MSLYFAYGLNLSKRQMKRVCPSSQFKGIARLPGYRLAFTRYSKKRKGGVASIEEVEGDSVWGALYELTEEDVDALDEAEGVPYAYRRVGNMEAFSPDGLRTEVWTYIGNKTGNFTPHKDYLRQLVSAARLVGLPQEYIDRLGQIRAL